MHDLWGIYTCVSQIDQTKYHSVPLYDFEWEVNAITLWCILQSAPLIRQICRLCALQLIINWRGLWFSFGSMVMKAWFSLYSFLPSPSCQNEQDIYNPRSCNNLKNCSSLNNAKFNEIKSVGKRNRQYNWNIHQSKHDAPFFLCTKRFNKSQCEISHFRCTRPTAWKYFLFAHLNAKKCSAGDRINIFGTNTEYGDKWMEKKNCWVHWTAFMANSHR